MADSTAYGIQHISVDAVPNSYTTSITVGCEQETNQDPTVSSSRGSSETTEQTSSDRQSHVRKSHEERFDFTLWYDACDENVAEEVREFLEDKHKLTGFIEERDFIAGKSIFHNIDRGVNNSEKILIVISRKSIKSAWFERIIHHSLIKALECQRSKFCVIPIYIDLEKKEAPSALKTVAGVKYTAKHFWKRLENTMGLSNLTSGSSNASGSISPVKPSGDSICALSDSSIGAPIQASSNDSPRT